MSNQKEEKQMKSEKYVDLLSAKFDKFIGTLSDAKALNFDKLDEKLMHKNMLKYAIRSAKKLMSLRTLIIATVVGVGGWLSWGTFPISAKAIIILLGVLILYFQTRNGTEKAMSNVEDDLFHIEMFAKTNKTVFLGFEPFFTDKSFTFKDLKDLIKEELKKTTIDEKIIDSFKQKEEEIKKENQLLKDEVDELLELVEKMEHEIDSLSTRNNVLSESLSESHKFLFHIQNNWTNFIKNPDGKYLDNLDFEYKYVIYQQSGDEYVHKHSKGFLPHSVKSISTRDADDSLIQSFDTGHDVFKEQEASRAVVLLDGTQWGIKVYFTEQQRLALKGDEMGAKIKLAQMFDQFLIYLEIVSKVKSLSQKQNQPGTNNATTK